MATKSEEAEIEDWFSSKEEDYDFMDNRRWALLGDAAEESEYNRRKDGGCCGSVDTYITLSSGRCFLVGFNYGH